MFHCNAYTTLLGHTLYIQHQDFLLLCYRTWKAQNELYFMPQTAQFLADRVLFHQVHHEKFFLSQPE